MTFLLSLLFLAINLLYGASWVWLIRWLLFNKKQRYIFRKKNILTPGLIIKGKSYVMNKIRGTVKDYLDQVDDLDSHRGYIYNWERKVYNKIYNGLDKINSIKYLPQSAIQWIKNAVAFFIKDLCSQFLRTFIPYMYEYYQVSSKIDLLDKKIDLELVESYYNRYVHKYFMWFNLACFAIIGIYNQVLYLIIA